MLPNTSNEWPLVNVSLCIGYLCSTVVKLIKIYNFLAFSQRIMENEQIFFCHKFWYNRTALHACFWDIKKTISMMYWKWEIKFKTSVMSSVIKLFTLKTEIMKTIMKLKNSLAERIQSSFVIYIICFMVLPASD